MTDQPGYDPTEDFRNYLKAIPQVAPKSLTSAFALMLVACAQECAEADRVPSEDRNWEYLKERLATRAQREIERQSDPAGAIHLLEESDLAPSGTIEEALVPVANQLLRYFGAYGDYHLSNSPPMSTNS